MQRPPAGGDQTPRQTDARCPNAPTFTGRDCHLQSSSNVVTLIRRAHAASAVFSSSLVTRTLHRVPSSTPRSLPFDRFVAAYNSYHCAPPFQVLTRVHRGCGSVPIHHMPRNQDQFLSSQGSHSSLEREIPFGIVNYLPLRAAPYACELPK